MYKILFTSALKEELNPIKEIIKNLKIKSKIGFLVSEIGNYKTIFNLTKYLSEKSYDFIVNIGICGYIDKNKPFQVAKIFNISNNKEFIIPIGFKFLNLESIACSEKIIFDTKELQDEKYVDMESYGFEFVCDKFKIPRIILKIPYDSIGTTETTNYNKNKLTEKIKQIDFEKLINQITNFLDKYKPEVIDFEKYFSHYKFTFSEKLIFQKMYFHYTSLTGDKFDDFFEKNKSLDKKEFLKIGSEINN
ncbi:MAG: hypothetical protein WC850_05270 [Candidatus Gracilibacteria bacterium]